MGSFWVWIYIHRQRKEWDAKEKEMVAYRLVDMMGRSSAANILGITVRELDKLVDVFELSEKFTSLRDPSAADHSHHRRHRRVLQRVPPRVPELAVGEELVVRIEREHAAGLVQRPVAHRRVEHRDERADDQPDNEHPDRSLKRPRRQQWPAGAWQSDALRNGRHVWRLPEDRVPALRERRPIVDELLVEARDIDVQIHPIYTFHLQGDVVRKHFGNAS